MVSKKNLIEYCIESSTETLNYIKDHNYQKAEDNIRNLIKNLVEELEENETN